MVVATFLLLCANGALGDSDTRSETVAAPEWLPQENGELDALVYLPRAPANAKSPVAVFLHGMCDEPARGCPAFASAASKRGFLVCPRARIACAGGGATWGHGSHVRDIDALLERVRARYPRRVDDLDPTIAGFSLGAYVAADLAREEPAKFSRFLMIGAKVSLDALALRKNGSVRILLGAGQFDLSSSTMRAEARRVSRFGVPAVFASLGNVGHRFADDMDGWAEAAFEWLYADAPEGSRVASSPGAP